MFSLKRTACLLSSVASVAIALPASAQSWVPTNPFYKNTPYVAGDMHNHNTCNDGSVSMPFGLDKALGTFNIDWYTQGNHGGSGNRDCRLATDPADPTVGASNGVHTNDTWSTTLGTTVSGVTITQLKGTPNGNNMWAWQRVSEIEYPIIQAKGQQFRKLAIEGLESIIPGHEHADVVMLNGQFPTAGAGSADKLAEFEYRWDRADGDLIGKTDASGTPLWPGKTTDNNGTPGHAKTVRAVQFLQAQAPLASYYIPTHSERAGVFNPDPTKSAGWNIEHFRDVNNAGPTVAFGIEAPGHAADPAHSYSTNAVGAGTYGGDGLYTAKIGGLWDGLLGEGRNSFIFLSSDWHQRGIFASNDRYTTADFFPGEYSRLYVPNQKKLQAPNIVDAMRSGNAYVVTGNLIGPDLLFRACDGGVCKGMGETLVVNPGDTITVEMSFTVPGTNISPYSFANPMLTQIGRTVPINAPVLDHVDVITGAITGVIPPTDPLYSASGYTGGAPVTTATVAASVYNPSTQVAQTFTAANWTQVGKRVSLTYTFTAPSTPMYVRTRGTNIPPSTPFVTDSAGNFLIDTGISKVPCTDPACPAHLPSLSDPAKVPNGAGAKGVGMDVEAWSSVRFQTNPVFIRPASVAPLLVETNAQLARTLAAAATP